MVNKLILAINPGSTSTKIALYKGNSPLFLKTLRHTTEELKDFEKITDEFAFRKNIILNVLKEEDIDINQIEVVVGRGGLVKPIESGIYEVNKTMLTDLRNGVMGEHASNLGGLIAYDIVSKLPHAKAYIADPVVVDEMQEVARLSGHPLIKRYSIFHALNQKAIARTYSKTRNKKYEELNLIVAHMGGGVSVGAHKKGRIIDVNNALDGDGPFSPERSGGLPAGGLVELCFSGEYSKDEIKKMLKGKGGMVAYLGTNSAYDVEMRAKDGDKQALLIQEAMAYQISKEIAAMAAVLKGNVDAILLTGGVAYNEDLVKYVKDLVSFIASVRVYPGEDEMLALAQNAQRVLTNEIEPKIYK